MKALFYFTFILSCLTAFSQVNRISNDIFAEINTNKGTIVIKLYQKESPKTVENFISLAKGINVKVSQGYKNKPFFNGLMFHRVINDFMIQTGDPTGTGTGTPGYVFDDEKNNLKHDGAGIVSMANYGPNTNGSQFFITHKATPWLDGKHTIFGKVIFGQDVVDRIQVNDIMNTIIIKDKFDETEIKKANDDISKANISDNSQNDINLNRTDGFYVAEIAPYFYGTNNNVSGKPLIAIKLYKDNKAVMLQSLRFYHTVYPSSSYYGASNSFNSIEEYKNVLLKNNSKYLDFNKIEIAGKSKNRSNRSSYYYDYIHSFQSINRNNSYIFSMMRESRYPNEDDLLYKRNFNPVCQINEFTYFNGTLKLNQSIYKGVQGKPDFNNLIEKQNEISYTNLKFIQVNEMSDAYIDNMEAEKLKIEAEKNKIAEEKRIKAEKEWAIQQEKNRLASIEFEKNRKLKLKSATVGDRICFSQDWTNTESSSGFFGFGSYSNKINYKMMIICYIERIEGTKMQVRVANVESSNKNQYSTPDYKGVKMNEGTIHWVNPYTDTNWLFCE